MTLGDTIVAISSSVGESARIIVRLSGPRSQEIVHSLTLRSGRFSDQVGVHRLTLFLSDLNFPAYAYTFIGPHSYTGDDLIELHLPGNPLLARMTLSAAQQAGARPADPGEFTARAYFNGRLDLSEAEGVAATIAAHGEAELAAARQLLAGELSRRLAPVMDLLADTLALVEVGIDFVDEEVTFLPADRLRERLTRAGAMLAAIQSTSARFEQLTHEPRVVLVGLPNAGKSTLLNALTGYDRAVVSPIAGTTRDALAATVFLRRGAVQLIDVAGVEAAAAGESPIDDVRRQMQTQAAGAIKRADVLVQVRDASDPAEPPGMSRRSELTVLTKIDLIGERQKPSPRRGEGWVRGETLTDENLAAAEAPLSAPLEKSMPVDGSRLAPHPSPLPSGERGTIAVSSLTGEGLDTLRDQLDVLAFGSQLPGATLALTSRHWQAIDTARSAIANAMQRTESEVLAMELRESLDALGQILGVIAPDELLGRIFSAFCIGK